ncbi:MAG: hypothetical protein JSR61_06240 [Proteobacteria bacterium]|nr:hypothetical protein [Pseudomonadota bacterium]
MHRSWTKLAALAPSARELEARAEALAQVQVQEQVQAQALQTETPSESLVPSADALADTAEETPRDRSPAT